MTNLSNFHYCVADSKHGISADDMELRTLLQEDPFSNADWLLLFSIFFKFETLCVFQCSTQKYNSLLLSSLGWVSFPKEIHYTAAKNGNYKLMNDGIRAVIRSSEGVADCGAQHAVEIGHGERGQRLQKDEVERAPNSIWHETPSDWVCQRARGYGEFSEFKQKDGNYEKKSVFDPISSYLSR